MDFTVLIPARLTSTRLPAKPLADIGGLPMIVRVAQRAAASSARRVVVAADHASIVQVCGQHGVEGIVTREDHASGSDRLAQACEILGLDGQDAVVNVQGDEPMMDPALIDAVAALLDTRPQASMSTAAHAIDNVADLSNPNVVKVVLDAQGMAMYFSRATIPWWRDAFASGIRELPAMPLLRHVGIYGYRAGFLRRFARMPHAPIEAMEALEQLRALWHGHRIAVHVTETAPGIGVDTPEDLDRVRALFRSANP
jgi:3-deoxy-manno-octulosonate cytidylyltransferase (CMP-KDO synthetase)